MAHNACPCKGMDRKLYRASEKGNVKLLDEVLKEATVRVLEELTPAGDTALHRAAFYGHSPLASKLIQFASADPEGGMQFLKAQNTEGNTALHAAAERGHEEIVKELVEKDGDMACVKNKAGETALFKASENGHLSIVEYLLDHTPESEELDRREDGQTPLHVAVSRLHTGVTAKLLDKRPALVHKAGYFKRTALHTIALTPLISPMPLMFVWKRRPNIVEIGKMLLNKDISLMYRVDDNGQSALHLGAKVGNALLVKVILSYGRDCTEISDKDGRTALHLAVENASQAYDRVGQYHIKYIISSLTCPRLIDYSDNSGQTALDIAIQKTEEDKQLFFAIRDYLYRHGARRRMFETETREDSASSTSRNSNWSIEIVSVNAVLIATVAFAAAFTLPGNIDSDANPPVPFLLNVSLFKIFILFDSLAFCSSIGTAVLIMYALFGNKREDPIITSFCVSGLWVALIFIALAFGAAIHLVVAPKCMWLAVLVWIMVSCLPILVRLKSTQGKLYMFAEPKMKLFPLFGNGIILLGDILWFACAPLYSLLLLVACVWGYLIVPQWRMLVRMLSRTRKKWIVQGLQV